MPEPNQHTCRDENGASEVAQTVLIPGTDRNVQESMIGAHIARETRARLSDRLLNESPTAELVHLLLIGIVAALIWGRVPDRSVLLWGAAVVIVTAARFLLRRHLCEKGGSADRITRDMRVAILFSGAAWGLGVLILSAHLGYQELALILVVYAGLVAGATSTLVADRTSFHLFTATLLIPLGFALILSGGTAERFHYDATLMTILYWIISAVILHRSHQQVVGHLEANVRLELSDLLLETERDRLQAFFDQAPIAIAMIDRESLILDVNPGFTTIFGYTREEAVGQDLNLQIARIAVEMILNGAEHHSVYSFLEKKRAQVKMYRYGFD